jgi:hydrogenase maturation protease
MRDALSEPRDRAQLRVVGIGNAWRRDDAVGLVVARMLRPTVPDGVEVLEREGEPTALIEAWEGAASLWLIDAVSSGSAPGTIHRVDASGGVLPPGLRPASTHHIDLPEALEVARALGRLPDRVIVFGIEGETFELGEGLSPAVGAAAERVCEALRSELLAASGAR